MFRSSPRIDMAELHVGAMFSTLLDLQTAMHRAVYKHAKGELVDLHCFNVIQ